uniref:Uncharacterized protein n=1 Tax=mine drainage metagenome TaxID=410659 RepID=E6PMZ3_9ZZZZ
MAAKRLMGCMTAFSEHGLPIHGSVQRVLQALARTELRNLGSLDLDGCAGARIATGTSRALGDGKGAETDEGDRATFFERDLHTLDHRVKRARGSGLGDVGFFGDVFDQFCFIHSSPLGRMVQRQDVPAFETAQADAVSARRTQAQW